jgi:hypothetical protein
MKMTGQSINDVKNSTMVNTQAISKLEMQMGQLANHLGERDKGKLPTSIDHLPWDAQHRTSRPQLCQLQSPRCLCRRWKRKECLAGCSHMSNSHKMTRPDVHR